MTTAARNADWQSRDREQASTARQKSHTDDPIQKLLAIYSPGRSLRSKAKITHNISLDSSGYDSQSSPANVDEIQKTSFDAAFAALPSKSQGYAKTKPDSEFEAELAKADSDQSLASPVWPKPRARPPRQTRESRRLKKVLGLFNTPKRVFGHARSGPKSESNTPFRSGSYKAAAVARAPVGTGAYRSVSHTPTRHRLHRSTTRDVTQSQPQSHSHTPDKSTAPNSSQLARYKRNDRAGPEDARVNATKLPRLSGPSQVVKRDNDQRSRTIGTQSAGRPSAALAVTVQQEVRAKPVKSASANHLSSEQTSKVMKPVLSQQQPKTPVAYAQPQPSSNGVKPTATSQSGLTRALRYPNVVPNVQPPPPTPSARHEAASKPITVLPNDRNRSMLSQNSTTFGNKSTLPNIRKSAKDSSYQARVRSKSDSEEVESARRKEQKSFVLPVYPSRKDFYSMKVAQNETQRALAKRVAMLNYNTVRRRSARYHYVDGKYVGPSKDESEDKEDEDEVLLVEFYSTQAKLNNILESLMDHNANFSKHREAMRARRELARLKQEAEALENRRQQREAEERRLEEERARLELQLEQERERKRREIEEEVESKRLKALEEETERLRLRVLEEEEKRKTLEAEEKERQRQLALEKEAERKRREEELQVLQRQRELEEETERLRQLVLEEGAMRKKFEAEEQERQRQRELEAEKEKQRLLELEQALSQLQESDRNRDKAKQVTKRRKDSAKSKKSNPPQNVDPRFGFLFNETEDIEDSSPETSEDEGSIAVSNNQIRATANTDQAPVDAIAPNPVTSKPETRDGDGSKIINLESSTASAELDQALRSRPISTIDVASNGAKEKRSDTATSSDKQNERQSTPIDRGSEKRQSVASGSGNHHVPHLPESNSALSRAHSSLSEKQIERTSLDNSGQTNRKADENVPQKLDKDETNDTNCNQTDTAALTASEDADREARPASVNANQTSEISELSQPNSNETTAETNQISVEIAPKIDEKENATRPSSIQNGKKDSESLSGKLNKIENNDEKSDEDEQGEEEEDEEDDDDEDDDDEDDDEDDDDDDDDVEDTKQVKNSNVNQHLGSGQQKGKSDSEDKAKSSAKVAGDTDQSGKVKEDKTNEAAGNKSRQNTPVLAKETVAAREEEDEDEDEDDEEDDDIYDDDDDDDDEEDDD